MQFHRSDIPKMGIAALVTAVIFLTIINWPPPPASGNQRISWDEAQHLKAEYMRLRPIMIEYTDRSGRRVDGPLEGFKIDASQIDEIINHNQNGVDGDTKADELVIFFGADGISSAGFPNFRIIAAGIQNGVLLKNANGGDVINSSIFDRADPCPPNNVSIN